MNFLRSLLLFSLAVVAARADALGPAVANPPSGPAAPPASSPAIAGPFLSPPLPSRSTVVDSAEMVPPVAQADPPPARPAPAPESSGSPATENVTINLIQLMVKKGLISKGDASALVAQAKEEAANAHPHGTPPPPTAADSDGMLQTPPSAPAGGGGADSVDVAYVPDVVRNQIRDEVTADVMQQAREEGLATKDDVPDWVHRFRVTGDIRARFEDDLFPDGNVTGQIFNFNAINTGTAFNTNGSVLTPPTYNTNEDRERLRLRARLGAEIDLGQNWSAGIRIGTGSDNQPVSENQTLGGVNSFTQNQGGDFSKYEIWLDRAFIRYEWALSQKDTLSASVGRFDNPFFSSSMIWADDLAFDGIMLRGSHQIEDGLTAFGVGGLFPVYNTDFNFGTGSSTAGEGYKSEDKWLYAIQTGLNWQIDKEFNFKGAVAFYDFDNIEGKVSDPIDQDVFTTVGQGYQGNTDDSRPFFAQNGNTYIALRNIVPGTLPTTTSPSYQYYGLATPFRELALTGQLDYSHFDPFHVSLLGEFVDNTAFDRSAIENNGPANDPGPQNNTNGAGGTFAGGNFGGNARLTVGKVALENLWDWNMSFTYRYIESDAVVDGFTDADFGAPLYGTNLQGYIIGGNLALSSRVWVGLRFMSADSIAGPTFHSDLVQLDLNAKF